MLVNHRATNRGTYPHAESTPKIGERYPRTRVSRVIHDAPVIRLVDNVRQTWTPAMLFASEQFQDAAGNPRFLGVFRNHTIYLQYWS